MVRVDTEATARVRACQEPDPDYPVPPDAEEGPALPLGHASLPQLSQPQSEQSPTAGTHVNGVCE